MEDAHTERVRPTMTWSCARVMNGDREVTIRSTGRHDRAGARTVVLWLHAFPGMGETISRWPRGTRTWRPAQTLIVSQDAHHRALLAACARPDTVVVGTPLDMIARLEGDGSVVTVVLAGALAADLELALFLRESYPSLEVRDGRTDAALAWLPINSSFASLG